jgi:hypothetical protein
LENLGVDYWNACVNIAPAGNKELIGALVAAAAVIVPQVPLQPNILTVPSPALTFWHNKLECFPLKICSNVGKV